MITYDLTCKSWTRSFYFFTAYQHQRAHIIWPLVERSSGRSWKIGAEGAFNLCNEMNPVWEDWREGCRESPTFTSAGNFPLSGEKCGEMHHSPSVHFNIPSVSFHSFDAVLKQCLNHLQATKYKLQVRSFIRSFIQSKKVKVTNTVKLS